MNNNDLKINQVTLIFKQYWAILFKTCRLYVVGNGSINYRLEPMASLMILFNYFSVVNTCISRQKKNLKNPNKPSPPPKKNPEPLRYTLSAVYIFLPRDPINRCTPMTYWQYIHSMCRFEHISWISLWGLEGRGHFRLY